MQTIVSQTQVQRGQHQFQSLLEMKSTWNINIFKW